MKRNYSLDLLRVVLSLCVITLHSINYFGIENNNILTIVLIILLQADGLFYMLSGYFNLEKEFNDVSDIKNYYKNKIIYVLFPFLAFIFVWTLWDYLHIYTEFNLFHFLATFYESIMCTSHDGHLWFLYPLIGLLLSVPFLSKMLHNMNEKELKIMWYIALGWNATTYFLCLNFGIEFMFDCWILNGWIIYFVAGYCYRHIFEKENKLKWTILGIVCLSLTIICKLNIDKFEAATDYQPLFTIFCVSCLMLWDKAVKIKNDKIQKLIIFLSKNTFFIYLFHMRAMEYVIRKFSITQCNFGNGMLVVIGTFIFSLVAAILANLLIKPIQKIIDRVWEV